MRDTKVFLAVSHAQFPADVLSQDPFQQPPFQREQFSGVLLNHLNISPRNSFGFADGVQSRDTPSKTRSAGYKRGYGSRVKRSIHDFQQFQTGFPSPQGSNYLAMDTDLLRVKRQSPNFQTWDFHPSSMARRRLVNKSSPIQKQINDFTAPVLRSATELSNKVNDVSSKTGTVPVNSQLTPNLAGNKVQPADVINQTPFAHLNALLQQNNLSLEPQNKHVPTNSAAMDTTRKNVGQRNTRKRPKGNSLNRKIGSVVANSKNLKNGKSTRRKTSRSRPAGPRYRNNAPQTQAMKQLQLDFKSAVATLLAGDNSLNDLASLQNSITRGRSPTATGTQTVNATGNKSPNSNNLNDQDIKMLSNLIDQTTKMLLSQQKIKNVKNKQETTNTKPKLSSKESLKPQTRRQQSFISNVKSKSGQTPPQTGNVRLPIAAKQNNQTSISLGQNQPPKQHQIMGIQTLMTELPLRQNDFQFLQQTLNLQAEPAMASTQHQQQNKQQTLNLQAQPTPAQALIKENRRLLQQQTNAQSSPQLTSTSVQHNQNLQQQMLKIQSDQQRAPSQIQQNQQPLQQQMLNSQTGPLVVSSNVQQNQQQFHQQMLNSQPGLPAAPAQVQQNQQQLHQQMFNTQPDLPVVPSQVLNNIQRLQQQLLKAQTSSLTPSVPSHVQQNQRQLQEQIFNTQTGLVGAPSSVQQNQQQFQQQMLNTQSGLTAAPTQIQQNQQPLKQTMLNTKPGPHGAQSQVQQNQQQKQQNIFNKRPGALGAPSQGQHSQQRARQQMLNTQPGTQRASSQVKQNTQQSPPRAPSQTQQNQQQLQQQMLNTKPSPHRAPSQVQQNQQQIQQQMLNTQPSPKRAPSQVQQNQQQLQQQMFNTQPVPPTAPSQVQQNQQQLQQQMFNTQQGPPTEPPQIQQNQLQLHQLMPNSQQGPPTAPSQVEQTLQQLQKQMLKAQQGPPNTATQVQQNQQQLQQQMLNTQPSPPRAPSQVQQNQQQLQQLLLTQPSPPTAPSQVQQSQQLLQQLLLTQQGPPTASSQVQQNQQQLQQQMLNTQQGPSGAASQVQQNQQQLQQQLLHTQQGPPRAPSQVHQNQQQLQQQMLNTQPGPTGPPQVQQNQQQLQQQMLNTQQGPPRAPSQVQQNQQQLQQQMLNTQPSPQRAPPQVQQIQQQLQQQMLNIQPASPRAPSQVQQNQQQLLHTQQGPPRAPSQVQQNQQQLQQQMLNTQQGPPRAPSQVQQNQQQLQQQMLNTQPASPRAPSQVQQNQQQLQQQMLNTKPGPPTAPPHAHQNQQQLQQQMLNTQPGPPRAPSQVQQNQQQLQQQMLNTQWGSPGASSQVHHNQQLLQQQLRHTQPGPSQVQPNQQSTKNRMQNMQANPSRIQTRKKQNQQKERQHISNTITTPAQVSTLIQQTHQQHRQQVLPLKTPVPMQENHRFQKRMLNFRASPTPASTSMQRNQRQNTKFLPNLAPVSKQHNAKGIPLSLDGLALSTFAETPLTDHRPREQRVHNRPTTTAASTRNRQQRRNRNPRRHVSNSLRQTTTVTPVNTFVQYKINGSANTVLKKPLKPVSLWNPSPNVPAGRPVSTNWRKEARTNVQKMPSISGNIPSNSINPANSASSARRGAVEGGEYVKNWFNPRRFKSTVGKNHRVSAPAETQNQISRKNSQNTSRQFSKRPPVSSQNHNTQDAAHQVPQAGQEQLNNNITKARMARRRFGVRRQNVGPMHSRNGRRPGVVKRPIKNVLSPVKNFGSSHSSKLPSERRKYQGLMRNRPSRRRTFGKHARQTKNTASTSTTTAVYPTTGGLSRSQGNMRFDSSGEVAFGRGMQGSHPTKTPTRTVGTTANAWDQQSSNTSVGTTAAYPDRNAWNQPSVQSASTMLPPRTSNFSMNVNKQTSLNKQVNQSKTSDVKRNKTISITREVRKIQNASQASHPHSPINFNVFLLPKPTVKPSNTVDMLRLLAALKVLRGNMSPPTTLMPPVDHYTGPPTTLLPPVKFIVQIERDMKPAKLRCRCFPKSDGCPSELKEEPLMDMCDVKKSIPCCEDG